MMSFRSINCHMMEHILWSIYSYCQTPGWCSAACLYKQKVSDATVSSNKEDLKGGFIAASWLPSQREILCVTSDQRLLFYTSHTLESGEKDLKLMKRLIGYNEEIIDLKFVGEGDHSLAVATNLEQVRVEYGHLFILQASFTP